MRRYRCLEKRMDGSGSFMLAPPSAAVQIYRSRSGRKPGHKGRWVVMMNTWQTIHGVEFVERVMEDTHRAATQSHSENCHKSGAASLDKYYPQDVDNTRYSSEIFDVV